jgi:hypothetical protein
LKSRTRPKKSGLFLSFLVSISMASGEDVISGVNFVVAPAFRLSDPAEARFIDSISLVVRSSAAKFSGLSVIQGRKSTGWERCAVPASTRRASFRSPTAMPGACSMPQASNRRLKSDVTGRRPPPGAGTRPAISARGSVKINARPPFIRN